MISAEYRRCGSHSWKCSWRVSRHYCAAGTNCALKVPLCTHFRSLFSQSRLPSGSFIRIEIVQKKLFRQRHFWPVSTADHINIFFFYFLLTQMLLLGHPWRRHQVFILRRQHKHPGRRRRRSLPSLTSSSAGLMCAGEPSPVSAFKLVIDDRAGYRLK